MIPTPSPPAPSVRPRESIQLPAQATIVNGGTYFAVYLAIGEPGSAELAEAEQLATELGYRATSRTLGCDAGSVESFRLDPVQSDWNGVAVYFESEKDAYLMADASNAPHFGITEVTTNCLG